MRFPRSIFSASLLAAMGLSSPSAHATNGVTVFAAVSSYQIQSTELSITGVPQGASAATTVSGTVSAGPLADACARDLLVMLNRPGRFTLTVTIEGLSVVNACSLSQSP